MPQRTPSGRETHDFTASHSPRRDSGSSPASSIIAKAAPAAWPLACPSRMTDAPPHRRYGRVSDPRMKVPYGRTITMGAREV